MKKVNIYLMNKGGVGKTSLAILTMLKLKKEGQETFKIVDCDSNKPCLLSRFQGTSYQADLAEISLKKDSNSPIDFLALKTLFKTLSNQNYQSYYLDFGQRDSRAMIQLINTMGIDDLFDYMNALKLELTFCPVMALGEPDCFKDFQLLLKANQGRFKIAPYVNMLHTVSWEDAMLKSFQKECEELSLELHLFNRPDIPVDVKSKIHNYLGSGGQSSLGLSRSIFTNIVENLTIA